jgi:hypothetical protein
METLPARAHPPSGLADMTAPGRLGVLVASGRTDAERETRPRTPPRPHAAAPAYFSVPWEREPWSCRWEKI